MSDSVIAIDGPSASGKSTVARGVATRLGYLYVDSGALYRGITWKALKNGIDTGKAELLDSLVDRINIEFFADDGAIRFRIDGIEPGKELRTETLNANVSRVAATPAVRLKVNSWLKDMVKLGNLVIEGRDIGTAVFPGAAFKFYLDASAEERARRRYAEIADCNSEISKKDISESLRRRDTIDSNRKMDPLKLAPGAIVIDSTSMTIADVIDRIVTITGRHLA